MPASGSCVFSDPADYHARLQAALGRPASPAPPFRARLTWVELEALRLLRANEEGVHSARIALAPDRLALTFPTHPGALLNHGNIELRFGEMMLHVGGTGLEPRTSVASRWGAIAMSRASLQGYHRALSGSDLVLPPAGSVLRPAAVDGFRLLRLHGRACRLAETRLERICHPEVVRALEQDLAWALVICLGPTTAIDRITGSRFPILP